MLASVGDRIIVRSHRAGEPDRDCEVLEVRGVEGLPPYVVRWGDSGHRAILYPGPDAVVQHFEHTGSPTRRAVAGLPDGGGAHAYL